MSSSKRKICEICQENLLTKFGTCVASVSLFLETSNKEFSSVLGGKPVVLGNLLKRIGIFAPSYRNCVCKKCARKIVNCYKLFQELRAVFVETSEVPQTPEKTQNRINERSPTGLTPSAKRQKRPENQTYRDRTVPRSKRSILVVGNEKSTEENTSEHEPSNVTDVTETITSLMNIPTNLCGVESNLPPIVKVSKT